MEEAFPGPQQGTDCALLETCSVGTDLCSSACHWSCAFGCICSMAGPFPLLGHLKFDQPRLNPWGLGEGEEG